MAEFESKIYEIKVRDHPHADRLDIAMVGDFRCVIGKNSMKTGELAAYIPEGAIVPDDILEEQGLTGRLAGSKRNRVKAVKLRKVLSQGLVYPVTGKRLADKDVHAGLDVTDDLGIVKYEPPIPSHMDGVTVPAHGYTLKYDIENLKKYPDALKKGEPVVVTEKLHGTWACFGFSPEIGHIVTSKGLSAKGLIFDLDSPKNDHNLYVQRFREHEEAFSGVRDALRIHKYEAAEQGVYVLGEIFGRGVQDLHYGQLCPAFRVFDIYVGQPGQGRYLSPYEMMTILADSLQEDLLFFPVPVLYAGSYDRDEIESVTNGLTVLGGNNVREGVVLRPALERSDPIMGRVILKNVSEAYLTRKGGSELA